MALEDNVLGYWKLNEASGSRVDSSPNGRDLTDTNTVTSQTGIIGNAAEFTRANLERLARTDTGLRQNGDITLQAWVYITSLVGAAAYGSGVVAHMTGDTAGDYWLGVRSDGLVVFGHFEVNGADADGRFVTNSQEIFTGSWHHIVCRRASGTQTVWVNGASKAGTQISTDSGWGTNGFNLGVQYLGADSSYYHNGLIDEAVVWARAVTNGEIATLYNSGAGYGLYGSIIGTVFRSPVIRGVARPYA